jgi:hypothetical protein
MLTRLVWVGLDERQFDSVAVPQRNTPILPSGNAMLTIAQLELGRSFECEPGRVGG